MVGYGFLGFGVGLLAGMGLHFLDQELKFPGYGKAAFKICDNCGSNCCQKNCGGTGGPISVYMGFDNLYVIGGAAAVAAVGVIRKKPMVAAVGAGAATGAAVGKLLELVPGMCFGGPPAAYGVHYAGVYPTRPVLPTSGPFIHVT